MGAVIEAQLFVVDLLGAWVLTLTGSGSGDSSSSSEDSKSAAAGSCTSTATGQGELPGRVAAGPILSEADLAFWQKHGYVVCKGAISRAQAARTAEEVWEFASRP